LSSRPLNIMERLRAESMNPAQQNRQLIIDAHEEIRILKDEVIRALARSVESRLKHEGGYIRMKDASVQALTTLAECKDHYNPNSNEGNPHEMWSRVTRACSIMYECMKLEGIDIGSHRDEESDQSPDGGDPYSQPSSP
jgi:hypothetical protein